MKKIWMVNSAFVLIGIFAIAGCGNPAQPPLPEQKAVEQKAPEQPVAEQKSAEPSAQKAAEQAPTPEPQTAPEVKKEEVPAAPPEMQAGKATLYRDIWGVPHIYATSMADAAYALGYAQAEDRLEDLYKSVRTAVGTMAEAFGDQDDDLVMQDYVMQAIVRNPEICQEYWKRAPEAIRTMGEKFMEGVKAYVAEHPERKPEYATELYGWQCAAISRTMILKWPLGTIEDDLKNKKDAPPFGSNAFAVAPSRSADKNAILMTDPHLTWEGLAVFTEARIHTPESEICGFYVVGSPLPALGHTARVAWACTTGGPDTSDVYMVKLNPENVMQYQYNGEWKTFDTKLYTINVKGKDPVPRPALYSLYGPVVEPPDEKKGIAYCAASPYLTSTGFLEEMFYMGRAQNCEDFYIALGMNQLMEQNILFADVEGNIQYVRNGATPIRPDGYNWSAPVPGGTDASRWKGIHDIKDLVQVKNPPQGYFQNCNVSPAVMMKDSPMTQDKYKPYIYNVSWDQNSPRGQRLLELLDADPSITKEKAMEYTLNIYDILAKPWQAALKAAVDAVGAEQMKDADFAKVVNDILAFDGLFAKESTTATIIRFWRLKCQDAIDIVALADQKPLKEEDQKKLLDLLGQTLTEMKQKYGSLNVKWGDIHLIGRGGKYFPCDGADFGGGKEHRNLTETVMDVGDKELEKDSGKYVANNGSGSLMLSFLSETGIDSYSLVAWGQSMDPNSPHYVDQAEKLYSSRKLKPTFFKQADLLKNVESRKVITVP